MVADAIIAVNMSRRESFLLVRASRASAEGRSVRLRVALLALLAAAAPGCGYMRARARDAAEIFRFDVGGALGFDVDTRLCGLLDLGIGGGYTWDAALLYGEPWAGPGAEAVFPGYCNRALGPARYFTHTCHSALPPLTGTDRPAHPEHRHLATPIHRFDLEVGAIAGIVHVRFGLSFGELADFFAGWFGTDLAGDDDPPAIGEPLPPPPDEGPRKPPIRPPQRPPKVPVPR
jgi:hypothetical protein